ncbi:LacI family transcriptional regulator [Spirochaetia bacterium]|nr:LacI family transcriptional regulator [Spirochaetia bacterium]
MPRPARLSVIADQIGVSTATVSKALAGKKGMSDALRDKIRETASALGYESPSGERVKTGNIGILVEQRFLNDTISFYWNMYRRLMAFLKDEAHFGILEVISTGDEKNLVLPGLFQENKTDGIIVLGNINREYRHFIFSAAAERGKPLVFLDSDEARMDSLCIISDGYDGMYAMTRYLTGMGHRDIRFVGSIDATSSILDRYYGYNRALKEIGLDAPQPIPDRDGNGVIGIALPENLPTAFACNCDSTAAHLIGILKKQNLNVPEDISVVGFDDYLFPGFCRVPLTTWAIDMDAMAHSSVDIITGKTSRAEPGVLVIKGRMVIRDSVRQLN